MAFDSYWASALLYAILLLILFLSDFATRKVVKSVERAIRLMSVWMIFFCFQDVFWGLCEAKYITSDHVFFASSSLFWLSTVVTNYFWLYFVLIYLDVSVRKRKIFLGLNAIVLLVQVVLLVVNFFMPTIFSIADGQYLCGPYRTLGFINQYLTYVVTAIITLALSLGFIVRSKPQYHYHHVAIFVSTMAPVFIGILAYLYPGDPFYSLSYFLTCYMIHIFIVARERAQTDQARIFRSLSKTFYSVHLIRLQNLSVIRYIEPPILTGLIQDSTNAQDMINRVIIGTASDDYREPLLEFVNLSTLHSRMKDNNRISCEFIGRNYGWTRISFVTVEKDEDRLLQVMVMTEVIEEAKRHELELVFTSNNDELTGLFNRHAYDNELGNLSLHPLDPSLVLIAMDVNGLKLVNDNLGHNAGDELLRGAAACMKRCFGPYGKIFRTGGDEFYAILNVNKPLLDNLMRDFDDATLDWKGEIVQSLSVSCGFVCGSESGFSTIREMAILADDRMYENKTLYYQRKGFDRKGQRDAHVALCALYTKILKINLTTDSFQIVNMKMEEKTAAKGFSNSISMWLRDFGNAGLVHPDDLAEYLRQTSLDYMKSYFLSGKTSLNVFYRRRFDDTFKLVMMELIPANDFSFSNFSLYLYVKQIDK